MSSVPVPTGQKVAATTGQVISACDPRATSPRQEGSRRGAGGTAATSTAPPHSYESGSAVAVAPGLAHQLLDLLTRTLAA
jgi:hypothetical protein